VQGKLKVEVRINAKKYDFKVKMFERKSCEKPDTVCSDTHFFLKLYALDDLDQSLVHLKYFKKGIPVGY